MAKTRQPTTAGRIVPRVSLADLDRLIRMCEETAAYCDKCSAAGLDVQPERQENAAQLDTARKMKRAFYPNAP